MQNCHLLNLTCTILSDTLQDEHYTLSMNEKHLYIDPHKVEAMKAYKK